MKFSNYSGLVCGFQFIGSTNLERIRLELELDFGCELKLVNKKEALASGKLWDTNLSNVFFLCSDSGGFPEKLLDTKKLTTFLEKYNLYAICVYEKGTFYHYEEVLKLSKIGGGSRLKSSALILLLSIIKLPLIATVSTVPGIFGYLLKNK